MSRRNLTGLFLILGAVAAGIVGLLLLRGLKVPTLAEAPPAIDILVSSESIYAVASADLRPFGWGDVDPADLRLEQRGEPHPFYIEADGEAFRLIFYGHGPEGEDARYTSENVYRLFRDGDRERTHRLRVEMPETGGSQGAPGPVEVSDRLEENALYAPKNLERQPWFWQQLAAPASASFSYAPAAPPSDEAHILVVVYATTESDAVDPDHHLQVLVNDQVVADETWDGQGLKRVSADLPEGTLTAGDNEIRIESPGDTGVAADIVLLDRIEVTYTAQLEAPAAPLPFSAIGGAFRFTGSEAVPGYVFDLGAERGDVLYRIDADATLLFEAGSRAIAGASNRLSSPAGLRAVSDHESLRDSPGARYLAIGAPELLDALKPLLEHRAGQGLTTLAVPTGAVYDQFGHGIHTPEAIRDFLRYGYAQWTTPPEYVLLVGDWSYDPHGYITAPPEFALSSFFVSTEFGGETASDIEFVKLDEDEYPDLPIGRFPARTAGQVDVLVEKTLAYEAGEPGDWSQRIVAVSDGSEPRFSDDAGRFLAGLSEDFTPRLIAQDGEGRETAAAVADAVDQGALILSYFGHGSISQWGKDDLFTTSDAAALRNGARAPILVNITCLAGLFTHPTVESLSETLLWNDSGGAVASLGATSLTLPVFQAYLSDAFVEALVGNVDLRLGDVLLYAQGRIPLDLGAGAGEVLDTFLLFGDPALTIPYQK